MGVGKRIDLWSVFITQLIVNNVYHTEDRNVINKLMHRQCEDTTYKCTYECELIVSWCSMVPSTKAALPLCETTEIM